MIPGSLTVNQRADHRATHGAYTLSATPGTVTSIDVPAWATVARLISPSALVEWRTDGDPAAGGSGSLTDGGYAPAAVITAIIVTGATTLRLRSATASATLYVEFRGAP